MLPHFEVIGKPAKGRRRRVQSGGYNCSGRESAISILRMFADFGISGLPHGEPYRSRHCQNMKTGVIAFNLHFSNF